MQRRKGADQFAVLEFDFPAQMLAAFEVEEPVKVDLRTALLDLERGTAAVVPTRGCRSGPTEMAVSVPSVLLTSKLCCS